MSPVNTPVVTLVGDLVNKNRKGDGVNMNTIISILEHHGFLGNKCEAICLVNEMRNWALDCTWTESPDEILDLTDLEIVRGVNKHYSGGLKEFVSVNTGF